MMSCLPLLSSALLGPLRIAAFRLVTDIIYGFLWNTALDGVAGPGNRRFDLALAGCAPFFANHHTTIGPTPPWLLGNSRIDRRLPIPSVPDVVGCGSPRDAPFTPQLRPRSPAPLSYNFFFRVPFAHPLQLPNRLMISSNASLRSKPWSSFATRMWRS